MEKKKFTTFEDEKDWADFAEQPGYLFDKDGNSEEKNLELDKIQKLDLHGFSLTAANKVAYTVVAGGQVVVDTVANPVTITLPSSPAVGDEVTIMDGSASNGFATNNCIIDRGGSNIEGAAANDTLATNNQCVTLIYANATKVWLYKSTNQ